MSTYQITLIEIILNISPGNFICHKNYMQYCIL